MATGTNEETKKRSGCSRAWLIGGVIAAFILLISLTVGGYMGLRWYLHSVEFRQLIEQETSEALHAEGQFAPFEWDGTSVYSESFYAEGTEEAFFERLEAHGLRATVDLNGIRRGVWKISNFTVEEVEITLSQDGLREAIREGVVAEGEGAAALSAAATVTTNEFRLQSEESSPESTEGETDTKQKAKASWPKNLAPNEVELAEIIVRQAAVRWVPAHGQEGSMEGVALQAKPNTADNTMRISGEGGEFVQEGLPFRRFAMEDFEVLALEDRVQIVSAGLRCLDDGSSGLNLHATGEIITDPEMDADLHVDFASLPLEKILPAAMKEKMSGQVDGRMHFAGLPSDLDEVKIKGRLDWENGVVSDLKVLRTISKVTGMKRFERLTLDEAWLSFEREDGTVSVDEFVFESSGLIKSTETGAGQFIIKEGAGENQGAMIDATIYLGVIPKALNRVLGAEKRVFTEQRDGYVWTEMRITGPLDDPEEDLSKRLEEAFAVETVEKVGEIIDVGKEVTAEVLRAAGEGGGNLIEEAGRIGGPLLDEGLKAILGGGREDEKEEAD